MSCVTLLCESGRVFYCLKESRLTTLGFQLGRDGQQMFQ